MNISIPGFSIARRIAVATVLLSPLCAHAQVGFAADLYLSQLCLAQNWDTAFMQERLKGIPKQARMQLFGSLRMPSSEKRCLLTKKPAPVELCNKAIASFVEFRAKAQVGGGAPFQALSTSEQNRIWNTFGKNICTPGKRGGSPKSADNWVPKDLLPDTQTVQLLARAERGDSQAQMAAHELYVNGDGVPADEGRAIFWLTRAADGGNADAQHLLGWKFMIGKTDDGVDFDKSIHYLKKAAQQGHPKAMMRLGEIHEQPFSGGHGTAPEKYWDMTRAIDWYTKAANLGESYAALALGGIYAADDPVPADFAKAAFWYEKSAQANNVSAMRKLSKLYEEGKAGARDAKAAQKWRRHADALGENGHALHLVEYFPWGVPPKQASAVAAIQLKHAHAGDIDAQLAIASRYARGDGVEESEQLAIEWWRRAATAGDPIGQRMLGKYLINDAQTRAATADRPGIQWLQKAAAQGDMEAQVSLAYWHINGGGGADRKEKRRGHALEAIRLMEEAARRGYKPDDTQDRVNKWKSSLLEE